MTTIKTILNSLEQVDRDALMAAFEEGVTHFVEYRTGRFIGVNTDAVPSLECLQQAGSWREGTIMRTPADGQIATPHS